MKTLLFITNLTLMGTAFPAPAERPHAVLTDFGCRDYVHATHNEKGELFLDVVGRGVVSDLTVEFEPVGGTSTNYTLAGRIISNNSLGAHQGVPVYTGDLSKANAFQLRALSDKDGGFKFLLPPPVKARTEDVDRYLYVGEVRMLLLQYKIPYPVAPAALPTSTVQTPKSPTAVTGDLRPPIPGAKNLLVAIAKPTGQQNDFEMGVAGKLARSQVPTADEAEKLAYDAFIQQPGLDARESLRLADVLLLGFDDPPFANEGDLIWEFRVFRLGRFQGVTGIIWVSTATKNTSVLFPKAP